MLVGVAGFEPAAPASRRQCSTRLSYTPKIFISFNRLRENRLHGIGPVGVARVRRLTRKRLTINGFFVVGRALSLIDSARKVLANRILSRY